MPLQERYEILGSTGIMYEDEVGQTRKVLSAAALTYVAGAASAASELASSDHFIWWKR